MRVIDVIDLAGGLSETADADTVNLSQRVADQMAHLYFCYRGRNGSADYGGGNPLPNKRAEMGWLNRESGHQYGGCGIAAKH